MTNIVKRTISRANALRACRIGRMRFLACKGIGLTTCMLLCSSLASHAKWSLVKMWSSIPLRWMDTFIIVYNLPLQYKKQVNLYERWEREKNNSIGKTITNMFKSDFLKSYDEEIDINYFSVRVSVCSFFPKEILRKRIADRIFRIWKKQAAIGTTKKWLLYIATKRWEGSRSRKQ